MVMQANPRFGNRIIVLVIALILAIASFFLEWGTIPLTADHLRREAMPEAPALGAEVNRVLSDVIGGMTGLRISVTGRTGRLMIGNVGVPYWVGILAVAVALAMSGTNAVGFSNVPRWIIGILLLAGGLMATWTLILFITDGSPGIGVFLFAVAVLLGLFQLALGKAREGTGGAFAATS